MQFIFLDSTTGSQLAMPVTPERFRLSRGRLVERLSMAQSGQLHLPGLPTLFNEELTFLLPAEARSYAAPGYGGNPYDLVDRLVTWSVSGTVLRMIVTQTPINVPVLLGPVRYGEQDGTGDVAVTLEVKEYRQPGQDTGTKQETGNRPREDQGQPSANSYTVVRGDCLWNICRRFYGDGSLAGKLAAANEIPNANLIFPGQVLRIPPREQL